MSVKDIIATIPKNFNEAKIPEEGVDFKNRPYKKIPLGKAQDFTDIKKNFLTALFRIEAIGRHGSYWLCLCDCGNLTIVSSSAFKKETQKSCGCWHAKVSANQRFTDLTEKTFGDLYVKDRNYEYAEQIKQEGKEPRAYWNCICVCGREVTRSTHSLTCKQNPTCGHCYRMTDYTNFKSGMVTALYPIGKNNEHGSAIWHCICECGNEFDTDTNTLSHLLSCGCATQSKGEYIIENILKENNIKYIYNKGYFKDLKTSRGGTCRYDFIILNDNNEVIRLIEFDGAQHYEKNDFFNTEFLKENDEIKNQYAKQHNIPLVRIPYWMRDKITLEMLMGDKYLVT